MDFEGKEAIHPANMLQEHVANALRPGYVLCFRVLWGFWLLNRGQILSRVRDSGRAVGPLEARTGRSCADYLEDCTPDHDEQEEADHDRADGGAVLL